MQILMGLFATATTIPGFSDEQYDGSPSKLYSPVVISSLKGEYIALPGILNIAPIISRNKRQHGAGNRCVTDQNTTEIPQNNKDAPVQQTSEI